jgi:hypothetical protein
MKFIDEIRGAKIITINGKTYPAAMPEDLRVLYDMLRHLSPNDAGVKIASYLQTFRAIRGNNERAWDLISGDFLGNPSRADMQAYIEYEIEALKWIGNALYMERTAHRRNRQLESQEETDQRRRVLSPSTQARKDIVAACKILGIHRTKMNKRKARKAYLAKMKQHHPDGRGLRPEQLAAANKKSATITWAWAQVQVAYGWKKKVSDDSS